MSKKRKESNFWTSYSDLMTSLFFVMLTLFVVAISMQHSRIRATQNQLNKITEIQNAIESIDTNFFEYSPEFKKHILKTKVAFNLGSDKISDLSPATKDTLLAVRDTIRNFITRLSTMDPEASYILIIEGQASRDGWAGNDALSYQRALSLFNFWFPKANKNERTLRFGNLNCEIVIAGAGEMEGKPREYVNQAENQRFLIQIMPKPGIINSNND